MKGEHSVAACRLPGGRETASEEGIERGVDPGRGVFTVPGAQDPDETGPQQQHEGQPAVVGDAPHLVHGDTTETGDSRHTRLLVSEGKHRNRTLTIMAMRAQT